MKLALCIAVLAITASGARAQAPGDTPPIGSTAATPASPPVSDAQAVEDEVLGVQRDTSAPTQQQAYETCLAERKRISTEAAQTTDLQERVRRYQSMPECRPVSATPPPPPRVKMPVTPAEPGEIPEVKSPSTALLLSLGMTGVGTGFFLLAAGGNNDTAAAVGFLLALAGPSTGHFYADDYWNLGLGLRIVGASVGFGGIAVAIDGSDSDGEAFFFVGAGLYVSGALYEIATAPGAARAYNREAARSQLTLAPIAAPHTGGLALVGSF